MQRKRPTTTNVIREGFVIGASPPAELNETSQKRLERARPSTRALELGARVAALHVAFKPNVSLTELEKKVEGRHAPLQHSQSKNQSGYHVFVSFNKKLDPSLVVRVTNLAYRILSEESSPHTVKVPASPAKRERHLISEEAEELARLLSQIRTKHDHIVDTTSALMKGK